MYFLSNVCSDVVWLPSNLISWSNSDRGKETQAVSRITFIENNKMIFQIQWHGIVLLETSVH